MEEKDLFREVVRKASKIVWRLVGICIIFALIIAVLLYQKHERIKQNQLQHIKNYMEVTDEQAYREIAWNYTVESDIVYAQPEGTEGLKLDVYRTAKEGLNPAVILLHGGGLTDGDKASAGLLKCLATDFAGMGYVVVVPNYRLSSEANETALNKAMEDAKGAYEWVLANGADYGVDTQFIAMGGYSSGADIAINLCYSDRYKELSRENLFGVIDISGGSLRYGMTSQVVPGCVIVHGTEDTTVRFRKSEGFAKKLETYAIDVKLTPLEGLNHDLLSRYDEVRNCIAEYLYKKLTGNEVTIDIKAEVSPEYQKVLQRMENGFGYEVPQLDVKPDGSLEEWTGASVIYLNQLKDAGDAVPAQEDFAGQVMLAWNKQNPTILYIAAKIQDDEMKNTVAADGKWYQDDCLEIVFDTSTEQELQQLTKWVIGAESDDLSVLSNAENTVVAASQNGNETTYEIQIDISKVPSGTYQGDADIVFAEGKSIGFSICYNDGEDGDRQHQIGWTPGKSSDRTTLGTLYFE